VLAQANGSVTGKTFKFIAQKTRMGCIKSGFHFLGVTYLGTQTLDITSAGYFCNDSVIPFHNDQKLNVNGGG
jgi:hypothetical protein